MIDIHSHIIFGVDDGAKNLEETKKLLLDSYNQGVRKIIATPHRRRGMFEISSEVIEENFIQVEKLAKEIAPDLEVYLGNEIYYKEGEIKNIEDKKYLTLAETDYILVEFNYEISYRELRSALNNIVLLGLTPVVAHIERYSCLIEKKGRVEELINMGCYMQINSSSVLKPKLFGDKHKNYKKRAKYYLDNELVHFIASDMHNLERRPSYMKEAYQIIEKKYGDGVAYDLFQRNQEKLLMNKMI